MHPWRNQIITHNRYWNTFVIFWMATCIHSFESCLIITWKIFARLLHIMENCCRNHRNTVRIRIFILLSMCQLYFQCSDSEYWKLSFKIGTSKATHSNLSILSIFYIVVLSKCFNNLKHVVINYVIAFQVDTQAYDVSSLYVYNLSVSFQTIIYISTLSITLWY
jgi:hypothetical protein